MSKFGKINVGLLVVGLLWLVLGSVFGGGVFTTVVATYLLSAWAVFCIFHIVYAVIKHLGNKNEEKY